MSKHYFFYDESEHSRKISYKTVSALNYYDNFIAMIVGWNDSKDDILQRYLVFETAYTDRKDRNGEIKSTVSHGYTRDAFDYIEFSILFLVIFSAAFSCAMFEMKGGSEWRQREQENSYENQE